MVNAWGNVADPSDMDQLEQVMQAHTASQLSVDDYRIVLPEIIDPPAPKSWPYSTFNYIVVDTNSTLGNCENRTALWKWVNWIVTSQTASEVARRKGYVQIPSNLATTVLSRVRANFTCSTYAFYASNRSNFHIPDPDSVRCKRLADQQVMFPCC